MRQSKVKSIRSSIRDMLGKKNKVFTKREYRRAKRFYNSIPRTKREEFEIV